MEVGEEVDVEAGEEVGMIGEEEEEVGMVDAAEVGMADAAEEGVVEEGEQLHLASMCAFTVYVSAAKPVTLLLFCPSAPEEAPSQLYE